MSATVEPRLSKLASTLRDALSELDKEIEQVERSLAAFREKAIDLARGSKATEVARVGCEMAVAETELALLRRYRGTLRQLRGDAKEEGLYPERQGVGASARLVW